MGSAGWPLVTEESPCHVCGKSDWCSVSADGKKAICRRKDDGTGVRRTDKSGQDYWLYELNGHRELILSEDVSQQDGEIPEKADPQTLDQVYGTLLDQLALSPTHQQDQHRRGLTEACIKRSGYRTLPLKGREELARTLAEHFGAEVCSQVPGLYENEDGRFSIAGSAGMLVPVRDIEGRIVTLKFRADEAGEGSKYTCSKYTYLSSTEYSGPGPGSQVRIEVLRHLLMSMTRGVDHTYFGYAGTARGEDKRHLVVTAYLDHPSFFTSSGESSMVERQEFYRKMNVLVRVHDVDLELEIATPAISQSANPS